MTLAANYKLKLNERKGKGTMDSPQFSLSYKVNYEQVDTKISYDILSALKGDNDVIIEVNSSLANVAKSEGEDSAIAFLQKIRSLGLDYSYRKVPAATKQSFLAQLFGGGKKENLAHEVLAYVPDKVWRDESFQSLLPVYGARYYVTKEPEESDKIVNEMCRMLDNEKVDYFKLIIFDVASFGQMGIVTNYLARSDLKNMLGL